MEPNGNALRLDGQGAPKVADHHTGGIVPGQEARHSVGGRERFEECEARGAGRAGAVVVKRPQVVSRDGAFWFTASYAAKLLGMSKAKIEAMATREMIAAQPEGNSFLIAESAVTALRRDPVTLEALKKAISLPRVSRGEPMPASTTYVGGVQKKGRVAGRIGHPLKDEGYR